MGVPIEVDVKVTLSLIRQGFIKHTYHNRHRELDERPGKLQTPWMSLRRVDLLVGKGVIVVVDE